MDILAHTLWANAGARKLNTTLQKKNKKTISLMWASFWGVSPDLFAFLIPILVSLFAILQGSGTISELSHHGLPGQFDLSDQLYNYSHSLVVFGIAFLGTWAVIKRPPYVLLGWALHILLDIPTHPTDFYPTPFLWPVSDYIFPYGFAWRAPWFMVLNYAALITVFTVIFLRRHLKTK